MTLSSLPTAARKRSEMLGIVGGMGPKATARLYLGLTNRFSRARGSDLPQLTIDSVAMTRQIEDAFLAGRVGPRSPELAEVRGLLAGAVHRLAGAGATLIAMPCNTLQHELARVCNAQALEHIDMIDATVDAIVGAGVERVLVLATTTTCRVDLYGAALRRHGVTCVLPTAAEQTVIEAHIRGALDLEPERGENGLAELLRARRSTYDGVVIACTDLSGDLVPERNPAPVFDSLECLAKATTRRLLRGHGARTETSFPRSQAS